MFFLEGWGLGFRVQGLGFRNAEFLGRRLARAFQLMRAAHATPRPHTSLSKTLRQPHGLLR